MDRVARRRAVAKSSAIVTGTALKIFMKYSLPLLLLMLAGCMTQPTVTNWLDPVSVASITSQTEPLVLVRVTTARKVSAREKVNAREFAQFMALEVNRMGKRHVFLVLIPRSSADLTSKQRTAFEDSFAAIDLRADGRSLVLTQYAGDISELGITQTTLPLPISGSAPRYYSVERDDLRALAGSARIELTASGLPGAPQVYEEWRDGRRSLADFISQLPGEPSNSVPGSAP